MQNQHNAMYREEEREMMPTLEYFGVGSIPWGPLAAGRKPSTPALFRAHADTL
jgi:aryl-alcohol dehydrogenase-like predicted oxidoreductase